ncbi:MAG: metabolite traffic protein EboE [Phycisphaeraceae bacterium]
MHHIPGPDASICYCTNVHAGATLEETFANLERYALAVKQRYSPDQPMGVGLWLSAEAAGELTANGKLPHLRDWLGEHGLRVFTLNGFPHGNFHARAVKHRVYEPDWRDPERLRYTKDLVAILAELLPEEGEGSISTLPVGWGTLRDEPGSEAVAGRHLLELMHHLARVELDTGKLIHIDLEPEPGCVIGRSDEAVGFFERHLLGHLDDLSVRAYLRICHDICHAAVMFEDPAEAVVRYRKAGISIGKVQVSSAVRVDFDSLTEEEQREALAQLHRFCEDRYLHQTTIRDDVGEIAFYDDLPQALAARGDQPPRGEWRVHFHVPIYLEGFGQIGTTQSDLLRCLRAIEPEDRIHHYEVETYAWNVLPEPLQPGNLAQGIADEMAWLREAGR